MTPRVRGRVHIDYTPIHATVVAIFLSAVRERKLYYTCVFEAAGSQCRIPDFMFELSNGL